MIMVVQNNKKLIEWAKNKINLPYHWKEYRKWNLFPVNKSDSFNIVLKLRQTVYKKCWPGWATQFYLIRTYWEIL